MDDAAGRALDEYLVSLSQAGSVEALDGLARHWTPRLLRYAARVLGGTGDSPDAARDVVQETWVGAIRCLRGLATPRSFRRGSIGLRRVGAPTRSEPALAETTKTTMTDPLILIGGPALLATMALVASFVPARASIRIDPSDALRGE